MNTRNDAYPCATCERLKIGAMFCYIYALQNFEIFDSVHYQWAERNVGNTKQLLFEKYCEELLRFIFKTLFSFDNGKNVHSLVF